MSYRLVGYQTADGRLWPPEDVQIVYETADTTDTRVALSYGCTCPGGNNHDPGNTGCQYGQVAATQPEPPGLQQAIHAAYLRLLEHYPSDLGGHEAVFGLAGDIATDAVEAAWPYAIGSANQHHWKRTAVHKMQQLQAAQAENQQLRNLLTKHAEWAGVTTIDDGRGAQPTYYCPACRSSRKRGHKPDCPIQAALGQVERAKDHP